MPDQCLYAFYRDLLSHYGPQGWWPVFTDHGTGYHPGDYSCPRTARQCFEICIGAILTQNTSWRNVEMALSALMQEDMMDPDSLLAVESDRLGHLIRPAGYFNQKVKKLKIFSDFFKQNTRSSVPSRTALLSLWGIGPETADSIRLYGFGQPEMVIDAYTLRILTARGYIPPATSYETAKAFCVAELPEAIDTYQEFHALMVAHAKEHYRKRKDS